MSDEEKSQQIQRSHIHPAPMEQPAPPISPANQIVGLMQTAMEKGMDPSALTQLVELHERLMAKDAERQYRAAFAQFQGMVPDIPKNRTGSTGKFIWSWADFAQIKKVIQPALNATGLSYSFRYEETTQTHIRVTCIVSHAAGHAIETPMTMPLSNTGDKQGEQFRVASGLELARRYAIITALGLTATMDVEEKASAKAETSAVTISDQQAQFLENKAREVKADTSKLLEYLGVTKLSEIRLSDYQKALEALDRKARQGRRSPPVQNTDANRRFP